MTIPEQDQAAPATRHPGVPGTYDDLWRIPGAEFRGHAMIAEVVSNFGARFAPRVPLVPTEYSNLSLSRIFRAHDGGHREPRWT